MGCEKNQACGGCVFRDLGLEKYQSQKEKSVRHLLEENLGKLDGIFEKPIFIPDGLRRRATMAFKYQKGVLILGFNENKSHQISDVSECLMLKKNINRALPILKAFLSNFCAIGSISFLSLSLTVIKIFPFVETFAPLAINAFKTAS